MRLVGHTSRVAWGLYLCEYGAFAPPIEEGPSWSLSGANLSFKRSALIESADVLRAGKWETVLQEGWRAEGRFSYLGPATVSSQNTMTPSTALAQSFWYGRGYTAERVAGGPRHRALARLISAPALPLLLCYRLSRAARAKGPQKECWRSAGWDVLLQSAGGFGEFVGYALGPPKDSKIF